MLCFTVCINLGGTHNIPHVPLLICQNPSGASLLVSSPRDFLPPHHPNPHLAHSHSYVFPCALLSLRCQFCMHQYRQHVRDCIHGQMIALAHWQRRGCSCRYCGRGANAERWEARKKSQRNKGIEEQISYKNFFSQREGGKLGENGDRD